MLESHFILLICRFGKLILVLAKPMGSHAVSSPLRLTDPTPLEAAASPSADLNEWDFELINSRREEKNCLPCACNRQLAQLESYI